MNCAAVENWARFMSCHPERVLWAKDLCSSAAARGLGCPFSFSVDPIFVRLPRRLQADTLRAYPLLIIVLPEPWLQSSWLPKTAMAIMSRSLDEGQAGVPDAVGVDQMYGVAHLWIAVGPLFHVKFSASPTTVVEAREVADSTDQYRLM